MSDLLKSGQEIIGDTSLLPYRVEARLGGGGEGEVYRVSAQAKSFLALKWYFEANATEERRNALQDLIRTEVPSEKFVWPEELASATSLSGYGYLMRLYDRAVYKSLNSIFADDVNVRMRTLITVCSNLAHTFLQLHAKGLCYKDISRSNIAIDTKTGDVLIHDCDNITVTGQAYTGVTGTSGYAAPEIELGNAAPSTDTDLHSLAVLLFEILTLGHPFLDGKRANKIHALDAPARRMLLGREPVFIFDPNDDSNRPDPAIQGLVINNWRLYPAFIHDLFSQAFGEGIRDPANGRVRESVWREALERLRDELFYCSCGAENFYIAEEPLANVRSDFRPGRCWSCGKDLRLPPRLQLRDAVVMLNYDSTLYSHHIKGTHDFTAPIAEMREHPERKGVWGLRNLSKVEWMIRTQDGKMERVPPGRSVTLRSGVKINFGSAEGEIKA